MLNIKYIRDNPDEAKKKLARKQVKATLVDEVLALDKKYRELQQMIEGYKAEQNKSTEDISNTRDSGERNLKINKVQELKAEIKKLEPAFDETAKELELKLMSLPNLPHDSVPDGKDENDNVVIRQVGEKPQFDFAPKEHWELGKDLDVIDTETAAQVSGSRFAYLKGDLARLEFALVQLTFDVLSDREVLNKIIQNAGLKISDNPFVPVVPPVLIKEEVLQRMARLEPRDERYQTTKDNMFLVGSAEHTLGPIHMDQVLQEKDLPIRYVGFSTAFRREAGSYGKDMKGILRMHQFDKLEMESFTTEENAVTEQDFIVAIQEYLVSLLKLPYQVVFICTGDMGSPDVRQMDIEIWMPGQGKYRETHTSDLMGDYQSRRLQTKVRRESGKNEFAHMNDATAFAIGRTIIAIMENYQQKDGSVVIPEVLRKYMGKDRIEGRK